VNRARRLPRAIFLLALAAGLLGRAGSAWGSAFNVKPTQLVLSNKAGSALLTVRNESAETLRFQLSAFAWDQSSAGEMALAPTRDVVFFPALLSLAPGEERNIRIGATVAPGSVEKTYRLFVEELPSLVKAGGAAGHQIKVLTRMSIPIFLVPPAAAAGGRIEPGTLRYDKLGFAVKNTGNVHFQVRNARVRGVGPANENLFERTVPGWYVLAGGSRVFEVATPRNVCAKTRRLMFEIDTEASTLKSQLDTRTGICGP